MDDGSWIPSKEGPPTNDRLVEIKVDAVNAEPPWKARWREFLWWSESGAVIPPDVDVTHWRPLLETHEGWIPVSYAPDHESEFEVRMPDGSEVHALYRPVALGAVPGLENPGRRPTFEDVWEWVHPWTKRRLRVAPSYWRLSSLETTLLLAVSRGEIDRRLVEGGGEVGSRFRRFKSEPLSVAEARTLEALHWVKDERSEDKEGYITWPPYPDRPRVVNVLLSDRGERYLRQLRNQLYGQPGS